MKKLFLFLVVIAAMWQVCFADLPDTVWSKNFGGADNYISDCKFTPDGQRILVAAGSSVYVLLRENGKILFNKPSVPYNNIAVSNDGKFLFSLDRTKFDVNSFLNIKTVSDERILELGTYTLHNVVITPDDKTLIYTGFISMKNTKVDSILIVFVSTETMEITKILHNKVGDLNKLAISSDGKYLSFSYGLNKEVFLIVYEIENDKWITIDSYDYPQKINDIKFSPDGEILGVTYGLELIIFNTEKYEQTKTLKLEPEDGSSINKICFSSDSKYLIIGFANGITKIINCVNYETVYKYHYPFFGSNGINITNDSKFIVSSRPTILYLLNFKGGITSVEDDIQMKISLQLIPNPSNNEIFAEYYLPLPSQVNIILYDVNGNKVKELVNCFMDSGTHSLKIDTSSIPSGSYFLKLECCGQIVSEKLIINK